MHCPFCQADDTKVLDSRLGVNGSEVRRRRECNLCKERFTTFERYEFSMPRVVKHDGSRENFDETKLKAGLLRALEKRPVSTEQIDDVVHKIVRAVKASGEKEIPADTVGQAVMDELRSLDQVAYVRFASVYRRFTDLDAFKREIDRLVET